MEWRKRGNACNFSEAILQASNCRSQKSLFGMTLSHHMFDEAAEFIENNLSKPFGIVGDYDADGIMATSILNMGLFHLTGAEPGYVIPDRFLEGYGLSDKAARRIMDKMPGGGIIILVDNGIASVEQVKLLKDHGYKVVILDHHEKRGDGIIPAADVIVDPKALKTSGFDGYCGAALAFKVMSQLISDEKLLAALKVYAGIATVTDVMDMTSNNYWLVKEALQNLNSNVWMPSGFQSLVQALYKDEAHHFTEDDFGFMIGPVLNAQGRIHGNAERVIPLLCGYEKEPEKMAEDLIETNELRKALVRSSYERAMQLELPSSGIIIWYDKDGSEGISGIISGKLTEKTGLPSIVFADADNGILKGSARSPEGFHIKQMLDDMQDLLIGYGGHAGAAGLSVKKEDLEMFKEKAAFLAGGYKPSADKEVVYFDLDTKAENISRLAENMRLCAPYGHGHEKPVIVIRDFSLTPRNGKWSVYMGADKSHLKLFHKDIDGVAFNMAEAYKKAGEPRCMDIIGTFSDNWYKGKMYPQFEVLDFKRKEEAKASNAELDALKMLLCF